MTRYKITVRGTDIELRGYVDGNATLRLTSKSLEGIGIVVASHADDNYNPFRISEPDYPPTFEGSIDALTAVAASADSILDVIEKFAALHHAQAVVIRGERGRAESAEKELMFRELHHMETEQENECLKADHTDSEKGLIDTVNAQADVIERIKGVIDTEIGWDTPAVLIDRIRWALGEVPE